TKVSEGASAAFFHNLSVQPVVSGVRLIWNRDRFLSVTGAGRLRRPKNGMVFDRADLWAAEEIRPRFAAGADLSAARAPTRSVRYAIRMTRHPLGSHTDEESIQDPARAGARSPAHFRVGRGP